MPGRSAGVLYRRPAGSAESDVYPNGPGNPRRTECICRVIPCRGEAAFVLAVGAYAHVADEYAFDGALLIKQQLTGGKARKNIDAEGFGLFSQPAAEIAEADNKVALIVEGFGHKNSVL